MCARSECTVVPVCMEGGIHTVPREVVTVEQYDLWVAEAEEPPVALLQFGSEACQLCPEFKKAVKALSEEYQFKWAYSDANNADTDLLEHFVIPRLPAFVIHTNRVQTVRLEPTLLFPSVTVLTLCAFDSFCASIASGAVLNIS